MDVNEDLSESLFQDLKLCGGNAQEFCALTNTVFSWNVVGFVGAMIICLGLVQFLASNASNYAHVNNEQRYIELKEVLYLEGAQDYPPLQSQFPVRSYPSPPPVPPPIPQAQPRPRKQRPMDEVKKTRSHSRGPPPGMGSARRNSYQNSLHGSNPWLNQY